MKKSNLFAGAAYCLVGGLCLLAALLTDSRLDSLLCGFAGAGIGPGVVMIWKYFYWSRPENQARYQEKLANETVQLHDERNVMLRDKAGRYAYLLGLAAVSASIVVCSVLGSLEVIRDPRGIVLYLGGYLVFQLIAGSVIYRRLLKKY